MMALAGFSVPASAADPVHAISISKDESVVLVQGLTAGDPISFELRRNGIQIGSALGLAPADGEFLLNQEVVTPALPVVDPLPPGDEVEENDTGVALCWTGSTPEILGGDVLRVTTGPVGAEVSEDVVVTDIDITQGPTKVDANTGTVRGRIDAASLPPISELTVDTSGRTATEARFDGRAPGLSDGVTGRLVYTSPGRFRATFDGLSPAQMGAFLDSEDVTATHVSASGAAGSHSTVATYGADARFTEDLCPPVARRAVTGTSLGSVNKANLGRRLNVWGVSADASTVRAVIEDRKGERRTREATIVGTGIAQTWSATFPEWSLRGLADGDLTLSADYSEGADVLAGEKRTIHKDTTAPARPNIRGGATTFVRRKTVRLGAPGAREVWFTLDGTTPRPNRSVEYRGAFTFTRSTTVKAIAVDPAGNVSRVATARFRRVSP
jgi:Chitobiase/beta-hexosaminidase C-terminal domain